jgi:hypothetical protein
MNWVKHNVVPLGSTVLVLCGVCYAQGPNRPDAKVGGTAPAIILRSVLPKSGVKFSAFTRICPQNGICD